MNERALDRLTAVWERLKERRFTKPMGLWRCVAQELAEQVEVYYQENARNVMLVLGFGDEKRKNAEDLEATQRQLKTRTIERDGQRETFEDMSKVLAEVQKERDQLRADLEKCQTERDNNHEMLESYRKSYETLWRRLAAQKGVAKKARDQVRRYKVHLRDSDRLFNENWDEINTLSAELQPLRRRLSAQKGVATKLRKRQTLHLEEIRCLKAQKQELLNRVADLQCPKASKARRGC